MRRKMKEWSFMPSDLHLSVEDLKLIHSLLTSVSADATANDLLRRVTEQIKVLRQAFAEIEADKVAERIKREKNEIRAAKAAATRRANAAAMWQPSLQPPPAPPILHENKS